MSYRDENQPDLGPWIACDRSGFKVRMSDSVKEWTGLRVARRFADERHPQDFQRAVPDRMTVPDARPEPPDTFIDPEDPVTAADL